MAYRSDPVRPIAKVVIQAESHAQLDVILLALSRELQRADSATRSQAASAAR